MFIGVILTTTCTVVVIVVCTLNNLQASVKCTIMTASPNIRYCPTLACTRAFCWSIVEQGKPHKTEYMRHKHTANRDSVSADMDAGHLHAILYVDPPSPPPPTNSHKHTATLQVTSATGSTSNPALLFGQRLGSCGARVAIGTCPPCNCQGSETAADDVLAAVEVLMEGKLA